MITLLLAISVASAAPFKLHDLEGDDGGFASSGDAGQWEWGAVVNGPGSGFDGANAWSTGRVADYLNASTDYLEIPVPSLLGLSRPMLSFQHWYELVPGDAGWLEVDNGNGWDALEPLYGYPVATGYTGATGGWRTAVFDLSGQGASPAVRLVFQTDLSGVAAGWTIDQVAFHDGDVAAPRLWDLTALADTDDLVGPYVVEVAAEDDTEVAAVDLVWTIDGVTSRVVMAPAGGDRWAGAIPAQAPDTVVTYWVEGMDGLNASREPIEASASFRVYLPAPTALTGPVGRVVALEASLSWTPPSGRNEVLSYEVLRGDTVVAASALPEASVPLVGSGDTFAVRAVYQEGPGDPSDTVTVDAAVPIVFGLDPSEGWPGDRLRVSLGGAYLLLSEEDIGVSLGEGVTVSAVDVRDVDTAWVDLALADEAAAGERALTLQTAGLTLTLPDAFRVLDAADRPRLLTLDPDRVRQGETGEILLAHAGELAGDPTVDLGEGVVVGGVERRDGAVLVRYTVTGAAPLGDRAVTLDDGVRRLTGVSLEVADALAPSTRGCGTPTRPGLVLVGLALGALVVRRRR